MISSGFWAPPRTQPFIWLSLVVPEVRTRAATLPFLIDTGSAVTVVHASDALQFLELHESVLNPEFWIDTITVGGVGGRAKYGRLQGLVGFFDDDGGPPLTIIAPVYLGDNSTFGLPSVFGRDLMKQFRLVVDGEERVTLTKR